MSMRRKKRLSSVINDGYRQTDISTYFKVTNRASVKSTMSTRSFSIKKEEDDSEELLISPRKKPKPIASEDEREDILNDIIRPLDTTPRQLVDAVIEEFHDSKQPATFQSSNLPITLPVYTYSESNWEGQNDDSPNLIENVEMNSVYISSEDEDFIPSSSKAKKGKGSLANGRKLTEQETLKKINDFLARRSAYLNSREILAQSKPNINKNLRGEFSGTPSEFSTTSSTSKAEVKNISLCCTIGVHKPNNPVPTTSKKPLPRILQEKTKNTFDNDSEFISTDFVQLEKNTQTSPKKIEILGNIVINSPNKTLQTCNLSPIRNETIRLEKNMEDAAVIHSETLTQEIIENSSWTTILFTQIVRYIGLHSHLKTMLTGKETDMLRRFFSMPRVEYQFFCFKLFTRIQKWYNIFKFRDVLRMKLSDPEMKNLYDTLYENKFVEIDFSEEPCIDLLNHLERKDLKEICDSFKIKVTRERKCELVEKLLINCNRQSTLTINKSTEIILRDRIKDKMGICVKLSPDLYNLFNKVHLLYSFTTSDYNKPGDLHFFLSKIISKVIYMPKINVNMDAVIFTSIDEFSSFSEAYECKRAIIEAIDTKQIGQILGLSKLAYRELKKILECYEKPKSSYLMRLTAGYKYTKALSLGAKHLARDYSQEVEEWLTFLIEQDQYCSELRGSWYDLLVMVQYNYLKLFETAANTLIEALQRKDLGDVERQELTARAEFMKTRFTHKLPELLRNRISFVQPQRLSAFPFIEIDAQAIRNETGRKGKRLYLKKSEGEQEILSVEDVALRHYYSNGYVNGVHCEGSLLTTIYFVLFWDIIYESPVRDAFVLELQYFPLDLMSPEFYTNRKAAIDQRIEEIQCKWPNGQLEQFILNIWDNHAHEKSFINDNLINEPKDLYNIILCIGRPKLAKILARIAKDFKIYRSGLPDLFLWTVEKKKCKFVEVKGEKDTLSAKQKLWLDFLLSVGSDAEVCHVHTIGCKTGRQAKRVKKEEDNKKPLPGPSSIKQ